MAIGNPQLSGVSPASGETDVVLKPIVQLVFQGPSLIDPLTWNSGTFAIYGPGDVVIDAGPGTILNQDIQTDPYTLIDGAVFRERIDGTFRIYTSGLPPVSGIVTSGTLGVSGSLVIAEFIPNIPLNAYTEYTIVLVGEDAMAWSTSTQIFPGVISWTSEAQFSGIAPVGSGILNVISSYTRTLPTILYDSPTGYNDTFQITITSGHENSAPKFTWSQDSDGTEYPSQGQGPHSLADEGILFEFSGIFVSGDVYRLDVYIPKPLTNSYIWSFTTSNISGSIPPTQSDEPQLIIDQTPGGGFGPVSSDPSLVLVGSIPDQMDYMVPTLSYILLEFNTVLSGVDVSGISITQSPLLGMPNISGGGTISPTSIEVSGKFLKLWLQ